MRNNEQKWRVAYVLEDKRKVYCANFRTKQIDSWNFNELGVLNHKKVIDKDLGAYTKNLDTYLPIYKQAKQIFGKNNIVKVVDYEVDEINKPINNSIILKK